MTYTNDFVAWFQKYQWFVKCACLYKWGIIRHNPLNCHVWRQIDDQPWDFVQGGSLNFIRQTQIFKAEHKFWTCLVSDHWIRLYRTNNPHPVKAAQGIGALMAEVRKAHPGDIWWIRNGDYVLSTCWCNATSKYMCRTWSIYVCSHGQGTSMFQGRHVPKIDSFPSTWVTPPSEHLRWLPQ